jgi:hypothetical protein
VIQQQQCIQVHRTLGSDVSILQTSCALMARRLLHAAAFTGLCGAVGYFATDALETALLFRTSSR